MIFKAQLFALVLADRKTMTRRPVKDGELVCRYRPGKLYAVQPGRGKPGAGFLHVDAVERQRLGDIDAQDAKREGFASREEFWAYWLHLYGKVDFDDPVWAISFTVMAPCRGGCGEDTNLRALRDGERIPLCGKVECARAAL